VRQVQVVRKSGFQFAQHGLRTGFKACRAAPQPMQKRTIMPRETNRLHMAVLNGRWMTPVGHCARLDWMIAVSQYPRPGRWKSLGGVPGVCKFAYHSLCVSCARCGIIVERRAATLHVLYRSRRVPCLFLTCTLHVPDVCPARSATRGPLLPCRVCVRLAFDNPRNLLTSSSQSQWPSCAGRVSVTSPSSPAGSLVRRLWADAFFHENPFRF